MTLFSVTYEIVTPESAEHGDTEERGYISRDSRLRDALADVQATRTSHVYGVEAIEPSSSGHYFDWVTIHNGMEYLTGARESRSLHIPDNVTSASRVRILRLMGGRTL